MTSRCMMPLIGFRPKRTPLYQGANNDIRLVRFVQNYAVPRNLSTSQVPGYGTSCSGTTVEETSGFTIDSHDMVVGFPGFLQASDWYRGSMNNRAYDGLSSGFSTSPSWIDGANTLTETETPAAGSYTAPDAEHILFDGAITSTLIPEDSFFPQSSSGFYTAAKVVELSGNIPLAAYMRPIVDQVCVENDHYEYTLGNPESAYTYSAALPAKWSSLSNPYVRIGMIAGVPDVGHGETGLNTPGVDMPLYGIFVRESLATDAGALGLTPIQQVINWMTKTAGPE